MKVLYADLICPTGHIFYNNIQILSIARKHKVDFVFQKGYGAKLNLPRESKLIEYKSFKRNSNILINALSYRLYMDKYQHFISDIVNKESYDVLFVSSFETFSFCLRIPYSCKVIAVCHNNIDYIKNNYLKRFLFLRASQKIHFVVLNKESSDYFQSIGAKHTMLPHGTIVNPGGKIVENFVFMPVNDCVDNVIIRFIQSDLFLNELQKMGLVLYIKEKYVTINHASVVKLPNYIDENKYNYLMNFSMAILLPYNYVEYKYRSSGLFYESVGRNKNIIVPNYPNFRDDCFKDDTGIYLYENTDDIISILNTIIHTEKTVSYKILLEKQSSDIITSIIQ